MSRTPALVIEFTIQKGHMTPAEWRSKSTSALTGYGSPTAENLAKHIAVLHASFAPGGVNSHVGGLKILSARIVRQSDRKVMAEWSS